VNGLRLKSLTFSVRGELVEPQKNTFAITSSLKCFPDDETIREFAEPSVKIPLNPPL